MVRGARVEAFRGWGDGGFEVFLGGGLRDLFGGPRGGSGLASGKGVGRGVV